MEDSEINQLPAGSTVTGTEAIPADQGTKTVYLTPLQITDFAASEIKTIENKTINLSDNALSGTFAEFNAACSDNDFLGVSPRVYSTVYAASFTFNINNYDVGIQSGMTGNTNVQALTGTPASFREVILAFKDDGTSRTITWDPVFVAENVNLPTATTVGEHLYVFLRYNSSTTNWGCVGVNSSSGGGGSGTVNSGSANELAYYASNGTTVSGLATQADSVLVTDASGVPFILATLPALVQGNITGTGTLTSGATGSGFTVALGTSTMSGVLPSANGGAGTVNGLLKANGSGAVSQAVAGTDYTTPTGTENLTNKSIGAGSSYTGSPIATTYTDAKIMGSVVSSAGAIAISSGSSNTVTSSTSNLIDTASGRACINSSLASNVSFNVGGTGYVNYGSSYLTGSFYSYQGFGNWEVFGSNAVGPSSLGTIIAIGGYRSSQWQGITFHAAGAEAFRIGNNGTLSNTGSVGSAWLHIKAGTATIAPIRLTSATLKTSSDAAGDIQFLTDKLYVTITTGTSVKEITLNDTALSYGTVPVATSNGRLTDGPITISSGDASFSGDVIISSPTSGLEYRSGANQRVGTATLSGGTVTVSNTTVTANTLVKHFRVTPGSGIQGHISYTKINSTSFTLNSSEATDDGIIGYELIELI